MLMFRKLWLVELKFFVLNMRQKEVGGTPCRHPELSNSSKCCHSEDVLASFGQSHCGNTESNTFVITMKTGDCESNLHNFSFECALSRPPLYAPKILIPQSSNSSEFAWARSYEPPCLWKCRKTGFLWNASRLFVSQKQLALAGVRSVFGKSHSTPSWSSSICKWWCSALKQKLNCISYEWKMHFILNKWMPHGICAWTWMHTVHIPTFSIN